LDTYFYSFDDDVIGGEVERGREYLEEDFNKDIEIEAKERKRVEFFIEEINQEEKTLIFGANLLCSEI
jgi:type I restriction enzyme R subunit